EQGARGLAARDVDAGAAARAEQQQARPDLRIRLDARNGVRDLGEGLAAERQGRQCAERGAAGGAFEYRASIERGSPPVIMMHRLPPGMMVPSRCRKPR